MTYFSYKARNLNGEIITDKIEAKDKFELSKNLRDKGYYIVKLKSNEKTMSKLFTKKLSKRNVAIFCKQFSVILGAGINICDALNLLAYQTNVKSNKYALLQISKEIQRGEALSEAFSIYNNLYPKLLLDLIVVGEQGGILDVVLGDLSKYYENEDKISKKIINALYYPIIVFVITIIVTFFIMLKVVPIFVATLVSLNGRLPMITNVMVYISTYLNSNIISILLNFAFFVILTFVLINTKAGKQYIDKLKLTLPLIKKIYRKIIIARFSRYCSLLLRSGLTIIKTLDTIKSIMSNVFIEKKLNSSMERLKKGMSLMGSLKCSEIFDELFLSMLAIGEQTGNLDEMLGKCADIYEDDVIRIMEKITVLIEPAILMILALLVGTIIISIVLPMFEIMNTIGM